MAYRQFIAVFVATCFCLAHEPVAAQTTETDQIPATEGAAISAAPAPTPTDAPAPIVPEPSVPSSDSLSPPGTSAPSTDALASGSLPVIAYVKHTKPVQLIDTTPGRAAFALVGAAASIAAGAELVEKHGIEDPSGDMAVKIATAYAASKGGSLAEAPVFDDHKWTRGKASELAARANGASYIVDVEMPGMTLIYFSFDWTHFDLMFGSRVRIVDAKDGSVVGEARCFLKSEKSPGSLTHSELLADNAAALKLLIAAKSEACVAEMNTNLKL